MPLLELNEAQHQALRDNLKIVLSDLSVEIASTDLKSFRDGLKEKRDHLKAVFEMLDQAAIADSI